jgi:hypothetical protein
MLRFNKECARVPLQALDVSMLQDAMLRLDTYQEQACGALALSIATHQASAHVCPLALCLLSQARSSLFLQLAQHVDDDADLEGLLNQMCKVASEEEGVALAADTPEATLLQGAQTYR